MPCKIESVYSGLQLRKIQKQVQEVPRHLEQIQPCKKVHLFEQTDMEMLSSPIGNKKIDFVCFAEIVLSRETGYRVDSSFTFE